MASNTFMLSYTVSRKETPYYDVDDATHWAKHVRDHIPSIKQDWDTHNGVETTLTGTMNLYGFYDKVGAAKAHISKEITPLFEGVPRKYKPDVLCVLVVNGVDEVIKFTL
ncbi:hypothetical protein NPS49_02375 [Pseudomonas putida]|uniref:hypothetical protein n=1 Tax=Pseudomonas TaxID=286 RepID=UPI0023643DEE|nr:hypothetical protein [Pseudomonas putida]MDD2067158.1 hypothetical protein [Pseudomonas putida]HDS1738697.1 hypothetical protein [Pseudomonas putida]